MPLRFAIHGFGRIGRALARVARSRPGLELVAVGDLADAATLARLLARDSVHGRFPGEVRADGDALLVDGWPIAVLREGDRSRVAWEGTGAEVVVEATGGALARAVAARHLRGPVERVVVSALAADADLVWAPGLATPELPPPGSVLSAASCTTHCLGLLLRVLHPRFGVASALMNEVHSFTGNQRLVDGAHAEDPRRGRAAASNIVPTYSAAPAAVERLMPELAGRLGGGAVRVPTPDVALLDLVVALERPATREEVAAAFREAADGELRGLLGTSDEPLVSSDFVGDPRSAIVDLPLLQSGGSLLRVMAWYDNEHGYAHRLADLLTWIGERPR